MESNEDRIRNNQRECIQKKSELDERRKNEPQYIIEPFSTPVLFDEHASFFDNPRTVSGLVWAEARLSELNVQKQVQNNVITYIYQDAEIIIYANPLYDGGIKFKAYPLPLTKKNIRNNGQVFLLPDRYKRKLNEHFERFIEEAKKTMKR